MIDIIAKAEQVRNMRRDNGEAREAAAGAAWELVQSVCVGVGKQALAACAPFAAGGVSIDREGQAAIADEPDPHAFVVELAKRLDAQLGAGGRGGIAAETNRIRHRAWLLGVLARMLSKELP